MGGKAELPQDLTHLVVVVALRQTHPLRLLLKNAESHRGAVVRCPLPAPLLCFLLAHAFLFLLVVILGTDGLLYCQTVS